MIKFIVVEDIKAHQKKVEKTVVSFMMKNNYEFEIVFFEDECEDFRRIVKENSANHIYILDFELPNSNAIDLARIIREDDWISPIIIMTAHASMAFETFKQRLQILDFISKQYNSEKNLNDTLEICMKQLRIGKSFKFKINGIGHSIPLCKILYFERDSSTRKVTLVTENATYEMYKSLKEIKKQLNSDFVITHRACIANMKRVEKISWKDKIIYFDDESTIDLLSKTHKKEIDWYV